jgi:3-methyladenine DNA glycosylase AlkD
MDADEAAQALIAEIGALPVRNVPALRAVRRARSAAWKDEPADFIIGVALDLAHRGTAAWVGCELIRFHKQAFAAVDEALLVQLADGLHAWDTVDALAMILAGPAWVRDPELDRLFDRWSRSEDLWMRRLALASSVSLSRPGKGGVVQADKVLELCRRLAADREDMVVKALSWALRALAVPQPQAVRDFLAAEDARLAARVKREVGAKLRTGLKNPRRR